MSSIEKKAVIIINFEITYSKYEDLEIIMKCQKTLDKFKNILTHIFQKTLSESSTIWAL